MKRQGFTLVELLVVIAIIALLMGILMPALSRVRQLAFRLTCGTNLSGIGKAMLIYANDYNDKLPRAGGRDATWGGPVDWKAADRFAAYRMTGSAGGKATISSCFYLLVKHAEVTPKSFVCKSDTGTTEWEISDEPDAPPSFELVDAWDFGSKPREHCSYAYHWPFGALALTTSSEPGMAVAADRNPWQDSPAGVARTEDEWASFNPRGGTDTIRVGNSVSHQEDGQNVLFMDSHVDFVKTSACGVEEDNIYTIAIAGDVRKGTKYTSRSTGPRDRKDSLLMHSVKW
jgi:prepilin-type N-terminal cleavage/methylation domain-containing protein